MNDQERLLLLHKRWTKTISPEELAQLEEWLASDEAFRREASSLETLWEKAAQSSSSFQPDTNRAWERFRKEMQAPAPARIVHIPRLWRVAASIAFLIAAAGLFWFQQSLRPGYKPVFASYVKIETDSLTMKADTLPDGSVVLVNSNTHFSYPKKQNGKTRNVYLNGEAFFQVRSDTDHPFVVHTSRGQITVTGTVFNVRALKGREDFEEVYLDTGIVSYRAHEIKEEVILRPKEKVVYDRSATRLDPVADPNAIPLYWVEGHLTFKDQKLKDVLKVMETYFHATFETSAIPTDLNCRYTIYLSGRSLEESMAVVSRLTNVHFEKTGPKAYYLTGGFRKPCE